MFCIFHHDNFAKSTAISSLVNTTLTMAQPNTKPTKFTKVTRQYMKQKYSYLIKNNASKKSLKKLNLSFFTLSFNLVGKQTFQTRASISIIFLQASDSYSYIFPKLRLEYFIFLAGSFDFLPPSLIMVRRFFIDWSSQFFFSITHKVRRFFIDSKNSFSFNNRDVFLSIQCIHLLELAHKKEGNCNVKANNNFM